jgi:hypothetical protein
MSRKLAFLVLALALVGGLSAPAHAYIDPGTGMTFASGIGGFIAALFAACASVIAVTFKRWVALLKSLGAAVKRLFSGRPAA